MCSVPFYGLESSGFCGHIRPLVLWGPDTWPPGLRGVCPRLVGIHKHSLLGCTSSCSQLQLAAYLLRHSSPHTGFEGALSAESLVSHLSPSRSCYSGQSHTSTTESRPDRSHTQFVPTMPTPLWTACNRNKYDLCHRRLAQEWSLSSHKDCRGQLCWSNRWPPRRGPSGQ